jgi:type I protein arginine methyltransferase
MSVSKNLVIFLSHRTTIFKSSRSRNIIKNKRRQQQPPVSTTTKMSATTTKTNDEEIEKASEAVLAKPKDISEADFANYFCTYGYLYHQKDMLEDQDRMTAYFNSVKMNPTQFKDKVVLDVGTGSGILAIWATQVGAKHVYAVEATFMATHAKRLIEANGLKDKITVIQSSIEDAILPEKVDVIISEWMGYFLLRESMFDSVIIARDKWMKPGGAMYPSHATMSLSLIKSHKAAQKIQEMQQSLQVWDEFVETTKENYGVDMSALTSEYEAEQEDFFMNTSSWVDIHPSQQMCAPFVLKEFDLNTATLEDIEKISCEFKLKMLSSGMQQDAAAFAGWFDVKFAGSKENPAENVVELTTAPNANGSTHWGQQAFYVQPEISCDNGNIVRGTLQMVRKKTNKRLMEVKISWEQGEEKDGDKTFVKSHTDRANMWHIE